MQWFTTGMGHYWCQSFLRRLFKAPGVGGTSGAETFTSSGILPAGSTIDRGAGDSKPSVTNVAIYEMVEGTFAEILGVLAKFGVGGRKSGGLLS